MYKISKKLALFCAVLLINPLVFTAKPGFAAQNNGGRVSEYAKDTDEKLKAAKSEYEEEADKKLSAAKSEYTKDTDKKLNSDKADDEKEANKPKVLRLIIDLDKDSLLE